MTFCIHEAVSSALTTIQQIGRWCLDVVLPITCVGCRREGVWLCPSCIAGIPREVSLVPCSAHPESLESITAVTRYHQPLVRTLITQCKYHSLPEIGLVLAELVPLEVLEQFQESVFVPLPLHRRRQRARGFNQAALITTALASRFGLTVDDQAVARTRWTRPQMELGRADRLANLRGAFTARPERVSGRSIVLVDDVATTGSSLGEAAAALRAAGAARVRGLVIAHD